MAPAHTLQAAPATRPHPPLPLLTPLPHHRPTHAPTHPPTHPIFTPTTTGVNSYILGEGLQPEEQEWLAGLINAQLQQNERLRREVGEFAAAELDAASPLDEPLQLEDSTEAKWRRLEEEWTAEGRPARGSSSTGSGSGGSGGGGSGSTGSRGGGSAAQSYAEFLGRQAGDGRDV